MADTFHIRRATIRIVQGDITDQNTAAIVNAANSSLMGGGGVDGAIHRRGGPKILEECRRIRATRWPQGLPTGEAVITTGGNLKAKYAIHTVGPIWRGGGSREPELLRECYVNSLATAVENRLTSIAFPSISTGAFGFPVERAAEIALSTTKEFIESRNCLEEVVFVLFSKPDLGLYITTAERIFTNP